MMFSRSLGFPGVLKVDGGVKANFGWKTRFVIVRKVMTFSFPLGMQPVSNPQVGKINKSTSAKIETVHKSEKVIFKAPVKG